MRLLVRASFCTIDLLRMDSVCGEEGEGGGQRVARSVADYCQVQKRVDRVSDP